MLQTSITKFKLLFNFLLIVNSPNNNNHIQYKSLKLKLILCFKRIFSLNFNWSKNSIKVSHKLLNRITKLNFIIFLKKFISKLSLKK